VLKACQSRCRISLEQKRTKVAKQDAGSFQSSSIPSGKISEGFADPTSRILLEPRIVVFTCIVW
jgi:hypothetical protein